MLSDTIDHENVRSSLLRITHILAGPDEEEAQEPACPGSPPGPRICTLSTQSTDPATWCWHCCHPCGKTPLPLPIAHDPKTDVFTVCGSFCSWNCMRGYSRDRLPGHVSSVRAHFMSVFRKRCDPSWKMTGFTTAPPRQMLKVFGGTLTIQEFRDASDQGVSYSVLPPKMLPLVQILEAQRMSNKLRTPQVRNLTDPVCFQDVSQKNESLRLRRSKPFKSDKNVIEHAMGINTFLQMPAPSSS